MDLPRPSGAAPLAGFSNRALVLVAVGYLGATAFVGLWLWQSWGGPYVTRVVDDIGSLAGILFAAGCAAWAARGASGRARRSWLTMTAALLAWAVGETIWAYYEVWLRYEQAPSPSWADAAYLLFPVGAGAAVLLMSVTDRGQSRPRLVLDGAIVAVSVFVISWVLVLDNMFQASRDSDSTLAFAVSLAYPIADAAVITIAWARAAAAYRPSMGLLVAGLILIAASDSVYAALTAVGGYLTGHLIDLGWLLGCGMLGLAALRSIGERPIDPMVGLVSSRVRLLVPYLPVLLAFGIGLAEALPQLTSIGLAVGGVLLIAAVLARQFLVLAENRQLLSDVVRLAYRDPLTDLPNRGLFLDRLQQALARQERERTPLTVLCLDLDDFKKVNDDLGHPAGDELLIRVARRLLGCLRSTDTVARLGGDEFAILIEGSIDEGLVAADRILGTFDSPMKLEGVELNVRPSIGLTLSVPDTETSVDDLIRNADLAMYAAKRDGGGCVRSFVPDLSNPYAVREVPEPSAEAAPTPPVTVAEAPVSPSANEVIHSAWAPRGVRVAFIVLTIAVIAFAIATVVRTFSDGPAPLANWPEPTLMLAAAGLVAARTWRGAADRPAWLLIAAGMAAAGLGALAYSLYSVGDRLPAAADPLFLAFSPLVCAGLILLLRRHLRYAPTTIQIDAFIVGTSVAAVGAVLMLGQIAAPAAGSPYATIVGLAYPIGGLALLALASASIAIVDWRAEWRWRLLIMGFLLWILASVVYGAQIADGTFREGTWLDACWPAVFLMIALASWLPSAAASARRHEPARASLIVPIVCGVAALMVVVMAHHQLLALVPAAVSLVAVAARFSVTVRDVGALAESHEHAMTDELTGLANRRALATALTAVPVRAPSLAGDGGRTRLALLLLHLDQVKEIHGSLSGRMGDELLFRVAARLATAVRPPALLARTGDDEFGLVLSDGVNLMTAQAHADSLMTALRAPFALDHITIQVDVSIAIAMWPDHCAHPQDLLSLAETAAADARAADTRIAVYDGSAALHPKDDSYFIRELRAALSPARPPLNEPEINAGELTCYYQPTIRAEDESVHSVEALVRWHHPTRGLLLPDDFLPAAEGAGLMNVLAGRVLEIALSQVRSWRDQGLNLTVAVNLSATNLLDLDLVDSIDRLLQTHRLPANVLILEITESTLATDSGQARSTVSALQRLGIRLSLDDYGTGWSSLARLQDLSVDELKLDQVFVARLARDPRSNAIVRSTVALAQSLEADLVAEGVEDAATLHALRQYGCTITQGHVHSPPLPADKLHAWVVNRAPLTSSHRRGTAHD